MQRRRREMLFCFSFVALAATHIAAQDWPQWRGPDRDATAADFQVPVNWPEQLNQVWRVPVGDGVATPALVGDRLFVFTRQGDNEVLRCLNAATGEQLWQSEYPSEELEGAAANYPGTRSSPAVAEGKVVTLGAQGTLSCFDAATGQLLWRKDEYTGSRPQFYTGSSPLIVDGRCVALLGGGDDGFIAAYDLATGAEQWKWDGDGPAYGSPAVMMVGDTKAIITPTAQNMVALNAADGELLWQVAYVQGRYTSASPIIDGQTLIYAGPNRGTTSERIERQGESLSASELWANPDNSLMYNTPVLKDGLLFGLSRDDVLFCIRAESGETAWSFSVAGDGQASAQPPPARGGRRGGRGRRGGGMRSRPGFGSIVAAGPVLLALVPAGDLIVFAPSDESFQQLARYKVAQAKAYAYPVVSGNRLFIKDEDSVSLWTIQ